MWSRSVRAFLRIPSGSLRLLSADSLSRARRTPTKLPRDVFRPDTRRFARRQLRASERDRGGGDARGAGAGAECGQRGHGGTGAAGVSGSGSGGGGAHPSSTVGGVAGRVVRVGAEQAAVLEHSLMQALQMHNTRLFRWLAAGVAALAAVVYTFRDNLLGHLGRQTADVASRSLEDASVQLKAEQVAKAVVHTVLNDHDVLGRAVTFLQAVLVQDSTRQDVTRLLLRVLKDPTTIAQVRDLALYVVAEVAKDPAARDQLAGLVVRVMALPEVRQAAGELGEAALQRLNEPAAQQLVRSALQEGAIAAMTSSAVLDEAKLAVAALASDKGVQVAVGKGIWNAAGYSVTPRWFLSGVAEAGSSLKKRQGSAEGPSEAEEGAGDEEEVAAVARKRQGARSRETEIVAEEEGAEAIGSDRPASTPAPPAAEGEAGAEEARATVRAGAAVEGERSAARQQSSPTVDAAAPVDAAPLGSRAQGVEEDLPRRHASSHATGAGPVAREAEAGAAGAGAQM